MNKFDTEYKTFLEEFDESYILEEGLKDAFSKIKSKFTGKEEPKKGFESLEQLISKLGSMDPEVVEQTLQKIKDKPEVGLKMKVIGNDKEKLKKLIQAMEDALAFGSAKQAFRQGQEEAKTLRDEDQNKQQKD